MTQVAVDEAKTRLSQLLDEVDAGGEVLITRRGTAVARLVAAEATPAAQAGWRPERTDSRVDRPSPGASRLATYLKID